MKPGTSIAACLAMAVAGTSATASAQAGSGATFTVHNDTGRTLECAIKKAGSGISEELRLNPGQEWTRAYPKRKPRNLRCLGAAPVWYTMQPGVRYRLAPNRDGLIVLSAAGG